MAELEKSLKVSQAVYDELKGRGKKGSTFDQILRNLLGMRA